MIGHLPVQSMDVQILLPVTIKLGYFSTDDDGSCSYPEARF